MAKRARKKKHEHAPVLVLVGDGIGNVIEQTSLIQAAVERYDSTDVWMPRSVKAAAQIITGLPGVRNIWREEEWPFPKCVPYKHTFNTFLVGTYIREVPRKKTHWSPNPWKVKMPEGAAVLYGIRDAGWTGTSPKPYVGYDEWDPPGLDKRMPMIGIVAGANARPIWRFKRYPHYRDVVAHILESHPYVQFFQVGVKTDNRVDHPRVLDLRDKGTIRKAAGLLRECVAVIGNDCGLVHVSAALHVPTFIVFGPTATIKNMPRFNSTGIRLDVRCHPCHYRAMGRYGGKKSQKCHNECMDSLPGSVVGQHVVNYLNAHLTPDWSRSDQDVLSHSIIEPIPGSGGESRIEERDYDELRFIGLGEKRNQVFGQDAEPVSDVDGEARAKRGRSPRVRRHKTRPKALRDRPLRRGK